MEPKYTYSESTVKPLDVEVGKHCVYLRKDVTEEERDGIVFYTYQEAKMPHDEFNEYANFIAKRNAINGVNDSNNIANLVVGQEIGDSNQLIIMEAIADLYDVIAGSM